MILALSIRVFGCNTQYTRLLKACVCVFLGDSAVRVAAAAADLRPLHATRLPHPRPHQVRAESSSLSSGSHIHRTLIAGFTPSRR